MGGGRYVKVGEEGMQIKLFSIRKRLQTQERRLIAEHTREKGRNYSTGDIR